MPVLPVPAACRSVYNRLVLELGDVVDARLRSLRGQQRAGFDRLLSSRLTLVWGPPGTRSHSLTHSLSHSLLPGKQPWPVTRPFLICRLPCRHGQDPLRGQVDPHAHRGRRPPAHR